QLRADVELVDQCAAADLLASQHRRIEGHDLEGGLRLPVNDGLQVVADVELLVQYRIQLDRAGGGVEGQLRHVLDRRRHDEGGAGPPVQQDRGDHHQRAVRRLTVLLRHQREQLADAPMAGLRVDAAEHGADDVAEPLAAGLLHRRRVRHVRQTQLVEDPDGAIRLRLIQGQVGDQRPAGLEALPPIRAGEIPGFHYCARRIGVTLPSFSRSAQSVPWCAVLASRSACSFLPTLGSALGFSASLISSTGPADRYAFAAATLPLSAARWSASRTSSRFWLAPVLSSSLKCFSSVFLEMPRASAISSFGMPPPLALATLRRIA